MFLLHDVRAAAGFSFNPVSGPEVRSAVADRTDWEEKKIFDGLAFMVNNRMACGIVGDDLMVADSRTFKIN